MAPVFGVSAVDQSDGSTYAAAYARTVTAYGAGAVFIYYNASTVPSWSDRCDDIPADHDIVVSTKKYSNDTQWVSEHAAFAASVPARAGKVYMTFNEEPEPDMSGPEFIRRADLLRDLYENHPVIVPTVCLQEWTLNPLSGRPDAHNWIPGWVPHIGWSNYAYFSQAHNGIVTPPAETTGRIIDFMALDGRTWSAFGWGAGVLPDSTQQYRAAVVQWLYDTAQMSWQADCRHLLWFDFDWTAQGGTDLRLRTNTELATAWLDAYEDFSAQANGEEEPMADPTFVGADSDAAPNAATVTLDLPAGLVNGDIGIIAWYGASTATLPSTPAGWTEQASLSDSSCQGICYTKTLTAAESSTSVELTAAIQRHSAVLSIYRDSPAFVGVTTGTELGAATTTHAAPSRNVAGRAVGVAMYGERIVNPSTGLTPPAGHTLRATAVGEQAAGSTSSGIADNLTPIDSGSIGGGDWIGTTAVANAVMFIVELEAIAAGIDLVVASASHTHVAEAPTLTQDHNLVAADTAHAHTADTAALTPAHQLAANETIHGHSADTVTVSQAHLLAPDAATHAHSAEQPVLGQAHALAPDDASHGHTAAEVTLATAGTLAVDGATHSHTADGVTLTQAGALAVDSTSHAHAADEVTVTTTYSLDPDAAVHAHTAESVTLAETGTLLVDSATHAHTASVVALSQAHVLVVNPATHTHAATVVSLDIPVVVPLRIVYTETGHHVIYTEAATVAYQEAQ